MQLANAKKCTTTRCKLIKMQFVSVRQINGKEKAVQRKKMREIKVFLYSDESRKVDISQSAQIVVKFLRYSLFPVITTYADQDDSFSWI